MARKEVLKSLLELVTGSVTESEDMLEAGARESNTTTDTVTGNSDVKNYEV